MKRATWGRIVLVTAPDLKTARKLARLALEQRLVACANIIPKIESHYWWQGRMEQGSELLMLFKTTKRNLASLEKLVLANHPYGTAEFVAINPNEVTARYSKWWRDETAAQIRL